MSPPFFHRIDGGKKGKREDKGAWKTTTQPWPSPERYLAQCLIGTKAALYLWKAPLNNDKWVDEMQLIVKKSGRGISPNGPEPHFMTPEWTATWRKKARMTSGKGMGDRSEYKQDTLEIQP